MFYGKNIVNTTDAKCEILDILKQAGIKTGDSILDFGCGSGYYAIPAAVIAGKEGIVYAIDTDTRKLEEMKKKAEDRQLENIVGLNSMKNDKIDIKNKSLNVVLLFDVLHRYYFPSEKSRKEILSDIYRLLKPGALLLVHPTHIDKAKIVNEIESVGFKFHDKYSGNLMHDGNCRHSSIFAFRGLP